jgi:hypothetical protein
MPYTNATLNRADDPAVNEHQYVQVLEHYLSAVVPNPKFVIDTGRNGVDGTRKDCAYVCARAAPALL